MTLLMWDELIILWQSGDFRAVHDWINNHWSQEVQNSVEDELSPLAQFLQALAFAALAFHFANEQNQESTQIFLEDSLSALSRYSHSFAGIEINPIMDSLSELRELLSEKNAGQAIPPILSAPQAFRFIPGSQL